jgi:hypothetical protein
MFGKHEVRTYSTPDPDPPPIPSITPSVETNRFSISTRCVLATLDSSIPLPSPTPETALTTYLKAPKPHWSLDLGLHCDLADLDLELDLPSPFPS